MALIINPASDTTYRDSIRRLLGGLDDVLLPDEDIDDPTVLDTAEFKVLEIVPNALSIITQPTPQATPESARIRLATIYIMASLLCPAMANRIDYEVKTIDVTWKKKPINYTELEGKLFSKAIDLLEDVSGDTEGDSSIFAIAPSKRAVSSQYD